MFGPVPETSDKIQGDSETPAKDITVAAVDATKRGIVSGVIRSLATYLFENNCDQKKSAAKIVTFLNALRAADDISEDERNWQYDVYYANLKTLAYASDPGCALPCCSSGYISWWSVLNNLIDDVNVYEWSFQNENGLNDNEKAIINEMREARNAYDTARCAFENYFRAANREMLKQILVKHGTTLGQIAPDWFKQIQSAAGLNQPVEKEG